MLQTHDKRRNQFIASQMLEQLGGSRFRMMTGAKDFVCGDNYLVFALPGTPGFVKDGINKVKIALSANDTYTVTMFRIRGVKAVEKAHKTDVYNEDLQQVFTDMTGLLTRL